MHTSMSALARSASIVLVILVAAAMPSCTYAQEGTAAEAVHHDAHAEGGEPNPLAVDPDLAIWTGVVFLLLFGILSIFAWPQIAAAVDERERRIAENIKAAGEKHEEAKRLFEQHEARLAAAAGEVRELLEEARRDAEHTKLSIVAEARKAADDERARSLRDIQRAKEGAIHELAVTSANVAIDLARKVVREQLTPDQQNKLVREALGKLTSAQPSNN